MKETKKLIKEIDNWISNNGACSIDVKEDYMRLYKKYAELWIGDLDDTIRYLRRLKSFLNKNKFNTRRSAHDYLLDKKSKCYKGGKKK